jgi:hypothetical protein
MDVKLGPQPREKHRMRVLKKTVQRKIFGPKSKEVGPTSKEVKSKPENTAP